MTKCQTPGCNFNIVAEDDKRLWGGKTVCIKCYNTEVLRKDAVFVGEEEETHVGIGVGLVSLAGALWILALFGIIGGIFTMNITVIAASISTALTGWFVYSLGTALNGLGKLLNK